MAAPDFSVQSIPPIEWLESVGSTNQEALRCADGGDLGPRWIAARLQTGGRGRNGRSWQSPPGNLYASLLLTFAPPVLHLPQLAFVAGLAVHDAASRLAPELPLRLKWPNDLLIDGAKLAGILIESQAAGPNAVYKVVVGIGVNLAHHPQIDGRATTSLAAHGILTGPTQTLDAVAEAFARWQKIWDRGDGFAAIRKAWLARAIALGTRVSVNTGSEHLTGGFDGLEPDGAMRLALELGGWRRISFGDVHIGAPEGATD